MFLATVARATVASAECQPTLSDRNSRSADSKHQTGSLCEVVRNTSDPRNQMDSLGAGPMSASNANENRAAYYDMRYIVVNWKISAGIKKHGTS